MERWDDGEVGTCPQYLALGHVTQDVLPDGRIVGGGTVLYATLTAQRLGYRAGILTAAAGGAKVPAGIRVVQVPSPVTSTFEHSYPQGKREQVVRAHATRITLADLPTNWAAPLIVHLGPVLDEYTDQFITAFPRALLGVTAQGWMRQINTELPARMERRVWSPAADLLKRIDLLVLSIEDVGGDEGRVATYARHCRCVVVTRGAAGVTLYTDGTAEAIPAYPASAVDTNGAGDIFAAALLIRLFETGSPQRATRFAAVAAALAVEGEGPDRIPSRTAILERL